MALHHTKGDRWRRRARVRRADSQVDRSELIQISGQTSRAGRPSARGCLSPRSRRRRHCKSARGLRPAQRHGEAVVEYQLHASSRGVDQFSRGPERGGAAQSNSSTRRACRPGAALLASRTRQSARARRAHTGPQPDTATLRACQRFPLPWPSAVESAIALGIQPSRAAVIIARQATKPAAGTQTGIRTCGRGRGFAYAAGAAMRGSPARKPAAWRARCLPPAAQKAPAAPVRGSPPPPARWRSPASAVVGWTRPAKRGRSPWRARP